MPESYLWLVNHLGSAFTLGTFHRKFKQLENTWDDAVSVKRLSASHWCAWAIGHDHRVYIYVRSSDVPIRVSETTYENQRWSPIQKFSKKGLIKTDRPAWSNETGTVYRPKESVRLPSAHWEWEGDWLIDDNLRGEVVGIEGWQYALDFPAVYTPEKHWNSFVRKRKWIRFRRFSSTDLWARISDMEVVERAECFIDVSVGGFLMPSQPAGFLSVWAVTNNGHVYVRTNVNHDNPEGSTWQELIVSDHIGIINISVGASNLVWAVTWDGNTLVRTHVTRNNIYGSSWVVVQHPDNSTRFMQVSVGRNSVWAISRDGKVWFRKGTSGDDMFWNYSSATGTSWVEMVGEMSQVAVSSNDQVFAIDLTGKNICFRTGVTAVDPTGKTWQPLSLHEDLAFLQKEGLLSEGDVCSCGDPDALCALHMESRPRLSSTTTSSSSISAATNVEESCDRFISPLQPFPIHITEPFSMLDSASSLKNSQFMTTSQNDLVNYSQVYQQSYDTSLPLGAESSSCEFLPTDCGTVNDQQKTANLQQRCNFHTLTPSTSQTFTLSQHSSDEEEIDFSQHVTTVVSSTAENVKPRMTESMHEEVFPTTDISVDFIQKVLGTGDNRLDHTCAKADKSTHNLHAVKEHTIPENLCESVQKINSKNCVIASCDIKSDLEDIKIQKVSLVPFSNVIVDSVTLLRSDSNKLLSEMASFDHRLSGSNNICESTDQSSTSHALNGSATLISHGSFSNNELTSGHSDSRLQTPDISADVFIKKSSLGISKTVETKAESVTEQKIKNDLNNDTSRFSFEKNDSSSALSDISFNENKSLTLESTLDHKNKKGQVMQKKKCKERRPKIIDLTYDNPNVLFKTFKSRKKRREKLTKTIDNNAEKTDTTSISSDTSHGLTDATELEIMNADISTSPESPEKDTDVDFVDGNREYLNNQDSSGSFYESFSPDTSNSLSIFPSLSSFSGDYLNAVGYSTDSAFTMLAGLETADTLLTYPQTQRNVAPEVNITEQMDSPKPTISTGGFESPKPGSNRNSPKSVFAESNRNSPIAVVGESGRNSPKAVVPESSCSQSVNKADNINVSGIQRKTLHGLDFSPNGQSCDEVFEHSSQQYTVLNGSAEAASYCDCRARLLHNYEVISKEKSSVNLPKTNDIAENTPVPGREHDAKLILSAAETKVEDKAENHSNRENTLETYIPDAAAVSGLVDRSECTENNSINRQQLSRIEEFFNNKCTSVDSTSNSEEVIDFVTDLLVSDDEVLEKKSPLNEDKMNNEFNCSSEVDEIGDLCQSPLTIESLSSSKSNFHSQISINTSRSRASSLSNMTRDFTEESEQNDIENTIQSNAHLSYGSSQSFSTGNHPKSLLLGSLTPAKKVSRYLRSPSSSYIPISNIIPIVALTMAQPRLSWKWLDATSCVIDDSSAVEWLSNTSKESEPRKKIVKIAKQLREDVMKKLQERNKREVHKFKDIEQAVKRTTWVKKASMQMYLYGRKSRWIACNVELEQGIGNLTEGSLTVHYQHKGKQKNTQITLSEMTCVKICSDTDTPSGFVVYTPVTNIIHQPLMLKANSENEAADWIGCMAAANAVVWNMNCSVAPGAIWSCTFIGDVFVSSTPSTPKHPSELCWGQHGGHTRLVETGPSGVTWALGFDRMPYVYSGGYGGAIHSGTSEMSDNTHQIMDHHKVFVYENQTWFPVIGWCCKGVFHNDFHWLTESGRSVETKEEVKLPSSKCQWVSEWTVDFSTPGGVDTNGWQYSSSLYGPFLPRQHLRSSYRRRRWFRQYKITVFGPWHAGGSLGLVDLSVQVDPVASTSDPVVLWAVGANGDVLCRNGVSASYPKGQSWIHVATYMDKPFKSISVGGNYRVWGIAGDGSTWFRPGVSPYNQAGTCWLQVVPPPPGNFLLHQVSAGATSVWAVDTGDNLWRRENITPTFPEGTGWEFVASRVKRVSVGPRDQVWIIADASFSKVKHGAGVIYSRVGITSAKPAGSDWEVVIGSGWAHVSVRGVSEVKQEDPLSGLEDESSI